MEQKKCAAVVQLGHYTKYFEGKDFMDILNEMSYYQDFDCLCNHARIMGTSEDSEIADRIEDWLYQYDGSQGDMHRFDTMDFNLSIGVIKCLGWAEVQEECDALREKFRYI